MRRVNARYAGRVQGVGFRATARALAMDAGVTGWVRNEPDGSVRLEAQGSSDRVDAFLDALATVMSKRIVGTDVRDLEPVEGEVMFEIRR